jgi:hypothetical protein
MLLHDFLITTVALPTPPTQFICAQLGTTWHNHDNVGTRT